MHPGEDSLYLSPGQAELKNVLQLKPPVTSLGHSLPAGPTAWLWHSSTVLCINLTASKDRRTCIQSDPPALAQKSSPKKEEWRQVEVSFPGILCPRSQRSLKFSRKMEESRLEASPKGDGACSAWCCFEEGWSSILVLPAVSTELCLCLFPAPFPAQPSPC